MLTWPFYPFPRRRRLFDRGGNSDGEVGEMHGEGGGTDGHVGERLLPPEGAAPRPWADGGETETASAKLEDELAKFKS